MASRDDDRFRVRPAAPQDRGGPRPQRFVSQVLKGISKAAASTAGARTARPTPAFGRGRVAANMAVRVSPARNRRVVIKSRFVVLKRVGADAVATHLRYIERDGVTREGGRGESYGQETDSADLRSFDLRGRGDRHQFRFIVSVEDAEQLEDLRGYTREFMQRMSTDLETRLDWVAVDHWDTDNPHTHVVLRGRTADGQDLVIAPDYMARGMRMRASELVTEWLGPRSELEISRGLLREIDQERLTSLDRRLLGQAISGIVALSEKPQEHQRHTPMRARLQRLETMRLAERLGANRWRLSQQMQSTLTAMGERGDILRSMQRALKGQQRDCVIAAAPSAPVVGRIVAKGLADELNDRSYVVIDGVDGRAHYIRLPVGVEPASLPTGGIVEVKSLKEERVVDRTVASFARDGIYREANHLARLEQSSAKDPQGTVDVHVRRLEALRRHGIVERQSDGHWRIPADFVARAQAHDMQKGAGIALRSRLPIDQQVHSIGATWLDRQLVDGGKAPASHGFGAQVRDAMRDRVDRLAEEGLAEQRGRRVVLINNLLATLRDRELASTGKALQDESGLAFRPLRDGQRVSGVYRRSVELASGRFAVMDDATGFSLVPWRPVIEQHIGHKLSAAVGGGRVTWEVGRQQGPAIG